LSWAWSRFSGLRFHRASALIDSDIAAIETTTRTRVLCLFEREGLLSNRPSP